MDKLNIYQKLQAVRCALQEIKMSKSGENKFAGFRYFELADFMPHINSLFNDHKLCGVVSFADNEATLTITDSEQPEHFIIFSSPIADVQLKGCHPIQNLGAVQTYLRRYLYVMALEIVEHDVVDRTTGNKGGEPERILDAATVAAIGKAATLAELGAIWNSIDKAVRGDYTAVKDAKKASLAHA